MARTGKQVLLLRINFTFPIKVVVLPLHVILFRHRIEVLREIALRLRELGVLPPFRANATGYMSSEHFQQ